MRTSFHHQSEAQPPNGRLTAATSPDTPSAAPASQSVSNASHMNVAPTSNSCGCSARAFRHAITRFTGSMLLLYVHLVVYGFWLPDMQGQDSRPSFVAG
jgi:hypothetical protein